MCCLRVGGGGETGERGKGEIESEMGVVRGAAPSGGGGMYTYECNSFKHVKCVYSTLRKAANGKLN
jgi:hypothetical protein